jgi:transposase-like protein
MMLAGAAEDLLAFSTFPPEHWSAIRSNNPQEVCPERRVVAM